MLTNWIPGTNGVTYLQNDSSIFASQLENVAAGHTLCGSADVGGTNISRITPRNATDLWIYQINCTTLDTGANTNATGLWQAKRTASNATALFKDGSSVDTTANSVNSRPSAIMALLALYTVTTPSAFSGQTIGCFGAGGGMTTQNSADLYTAINTYYASL
jgi:hypothetical protein